MAYAAKGSSGGASKGYSTSSVPKRGYNMGSMRGYNAGGMSSKGYSTGASSPNGYTPAGRSTYTGPKGLEGLTSTSGNTPTMYGLDGVRGMAYSSTGMSPTSRTMSYSITRNADGSVTETCSVSETYGRHGGMDNELFKALMANSFPMNHYDQKEKEDKKNEEERRRRKIEEMELQKLRLMNSERMIIFNPSNFVTSHTPFVGEAEQIMPYVEEAFRKTTGKNLPNDFSLVLCDKEELKTAHQFFNGMWNDGIQGFCVNRNGFGESRIFVKKDELAKVMLTVGHEIGHLQTSSLNGVEEEAKAFAFSMEWMNKIKENNIANLENTIITEHPAENGLHNVAFDFVANMMRQGVNAIDVFNGLIEGRKVAG